jgi:hypothetical protein
LNLKTLNEYPTNEIQSQLSFAELSDLDKLVENNPSSNFFIDEAPVSEENFPTEMLAKISKNVSPSNSLWIACQSDKPPYRENSVLDGNYFLQVCFG